MKIHLHNKKNYNMFKNSFIMFNNLYKLTASNLTTQQRNVTTSLIKWTLTKHQKPLAHLNKDIRFIRHKSDEGCCDPCDKPEDIQSKNGLARVGNYNKKWVKDRFISLSLILAMPLALIYPTHIGDVFFISSVMMHQHWGIEGIVRDYVREIYFGKNISKVAIMVVRCMSLVVTFGLFHFTYTQCCIGESVRKFWAIKGCTGME